MKKWEQLFNHQHNEAALSTLQCLPHIPIEFLFNSPFEPYIKIDMNLAEPIPQSTPRLGSTGTEPALNSENEWAPALEPSQDVNIQHEREVFEASLRALSHRRRDANATESLKLVEFSVEMPDARVVKLAADFTDWEESPLDMIRFADGMWSTTVPLPSGIYAYRFLVDGEWYDDPRACLRDPDASLSARSFVRVR